MRFAWNFLFRCFWGLRTLASGGQQPCTTPSLRPLCILSSKGSPRITLYECLFSTVLLVYFLEYQFQGPCSHPVWFKSFTDVLPSFFIVCKIYFCFNCTPYCWGELWAKWMVWCPAEWDQLAAKRCDVMSRHFKEDFPGIGATWFWEFIRKQDQGRDKFKSTFSSTEQHWVSHAFLTVLWRDLVTH